MHKNLALGVMSEKEAAYLAQKLRNEILAAARLRTSDIGLASAQKKKPKGKTMAELLEGYSKIKYHKPFDSLSKVQQNEVYLEIINSAGRPNSSVNVRGKNLSKLGKSLMVVTFGVAVFNVATAEHKGKAAVSEGLNIGSGFAGGLAGGFMAGMACGPGAPVCVSIGVFIGGALGALGMEYSMGWFF